MFDPPKVRKGQKLKLLWGFFRPQFAYFCLFWHLERPRPASQWVRPNFFGPESGQTIPLHHSIAKYLKNLKLIPRTTTFFLRHCVKRDGKWVKWTYLDYLRDVQIVAKAFIALGLEPYNSVCISGFNSPEWFFSDVAAIFAGAKVHIDTTYIDYYSIKHKFP